MGANGANRSLLFRELSVVLTGEAEVSPTTADRHLATLSQRLGETEIGEVLERFDALKAQGGDLSAAVGDQIIANASLGPAAKAIVLLWFAGVPDLSPGAPGPASEADYFEALMWTALGAHPPGCSDGYYGHWRYPPDTGV